MLNRDRFNRFVPGIDVDLLLILWTMRDARKRASKPRDGLDRGFSAR